MGTKKKFTPEELKHLQANPYTLRVTANSISYTLAFKEAFWGLEPARVHRTGRLPQAGL